MKVLNNVDPDINPWDTAAVMSGLQLGFVSLITTLWSWMFSQFSIHLIVHLSSLYFISLSI